MHPSACRNGTRLFALLVPYFSILRRLRELKAGARRSVTTAAIGLVLLAVFLCSCERRDPRPPVILIIIDTLRADHLGSYGYSLDTSPTIDELASKSHLFENNSTQCNVTMASITSVLTGLYPRTHHNYLPAPIKGRYEPLLEHRTLAERMRTKGYRTAAFVSHPYWTDESPDAPVQRGWDFYSVIPDEIEGVDRLKYDNGGYTNRRVFSFLDEYEESDDQPLFLWVHYFDPHGAYAPPADWEKKHLLAHLQEIGRADLYPALADVPLTDRNAVAAAVGPSPRVWQAVRRALYDAEISYCDFEIGRLFEKLRQMDLYDEALIVLLADHGENLGESRPGVGRVGMNHDRLFEPVVHVPLIIKLPGQTKGTRTDAITESIDVMPTLVDLIGLDAEPKMEGSTLRPLFTNPRARRDARVFMQSCSNFEKAVRTDEFKLIQTGRESAPLLYRWRRDRQERRDLAGQRGARSTVRRMDRWLREFIPPDVIRVRFLPDVAPYEMRLTLESPQRILKGGRRLPDGPIEGDESAFRWEGRIDREAVDLQVPLGERGGLIYVRAERADGLPLVERTWIGQTPLAASTAVPVFVAAGAPARGSRYDLSFEPASHTWGFALDLPSAAAAEIEVRDQRASPKESFAIIESEGFELDRVGAPGVFAFLRGKGPGKAHARVRYPAGDGNALALLRVDGRWPKFEEVSFDGEAVRSDRIEFALAHRSDQRLTAALLAGPAPDAGPGGILIWLQGGASGTAIDPAGLSKDRVEQLRALGYIH